MNAHINISFRDRIIYVIFFLSILPCLIFAQIPELESIPQNLPDDIHKILIKLHGKLDSQLDKLTFHNDLFKIEYAAVEQGSDREKQAYIELDKLNQEKNDYCNSAIKYNQLVSTAITISDLKKQIALITKDKSLTYNNESKNLKDIRNDLSKNETLFYQVLKK